MLSYDKKLKALSQHLRKNMTDAEKMLGLKLVCLGSGNDNKVLI